MIHPLLGSIHPACWPAEGSAMSLLDPLGIFDGGGSSSSASVTSTVNLDIKGLDKIGLTETIDIKPIEVKPLAITDTVTLSPIEIKPLTVNENVDIKPLALTENIDLSPVTLNENIDLRPVAVDTCQTLRLAPLPETKVHNPYHHHVAMSLFGVELMAMTFHGETEQEIRSPRRPQVTERTRSRAQRAREPRAVLDGGEGLRIRVLNDDD
jgi:hypothetical protein